MDNCAVSTCGRRAERGRLGGLTEEKGVQGVVLRRTRGARVVDACDEPNCDPTCAPAWGEEDME